MLIFISYVTTRTSFRYIKVNLLFFCFVDTKSFILIIIEISRHFLNLCVDFFSSVFLLNTRPSHTG